MWIHVNKETRQIEGYTGNCISKPIAAKGNELIEVESIPGDWQYCKYINGEYVLDNEYKTSKIEETELLNIRTKREIECFPFINRGALWYELLTTEQKEELKVWYQAWLDAPTTNLIPDKPSWLV